jgi:hypothetical protein
MAAPPFMNRLPKKSSLSRNARNSRELHDVQAKSEKFFGGGVLALTQQSCRREGIA